MIDLYSPKLENQLPFLVMMVPNSFLRDFPHIRRNLNENSQRLVVGNDVHRTLLDVSLLKMKCIMLFRKILELSSQVHLDTKSMYGHTLFDVVPNRDCKSTGMIEELCKCHPKPDQ